MSKQSEIPDPLQMWREWVDQAEHRWNTVLNEVMSSEPFSQASGRMMEGLFGLQTSMNEATQRYFSALNLPTRTDLMTVAERLSAIEARLADIERRLPTGGSSRPAASRPKPKRTKKAAPKAAPARSATKKAAVKKAGVKKKAAKKTARKSAS